MTLFNPGASVIFRVPGLHPDPGQCLGPVEGVLLSHDPVSHRVVAQCPLGHEHDVDEQNVKLAAGSGGSP